MNYFRICFLFGFLFVAALLNVRSEAKPLLEDLLAFGHYCRADDKLCQVKEQLSVVNKKKNPTPQELCEACHYAMPVMRSLVRKNETKYLHDIATLVCVTLKLTEEYICYQAVGLFEVIDTFFFSS